VGPRAAADGAVREGNVKLVTVAGSGLFSCLSAGEDRGDVECVEGTGSGAGLL
jgi:hypothetical protein